MYDSQSYSGSLDHESPIRSPLNATRVSTSEAERQGQPGTNKVVHIISNELGAQTGLMKSLKQLIQLCDQLKQCGIEKEIELPMIAAIGAQSAGKSSLIESLVGYSFLPRGGGMMTKRPLELTLVQIEDGDPYAIFYEEENAKPISIESVHSTITALTEKKAKGQIISDDPIRLRIYSPFCPNLSLVDLPGITRNSDTHKDVNLLELTTDLTKKYVKKERTIILAVSAANVDIGNSEAISISRDEEVDPDGLRTLGVLTKADKAEKEEKFLPTLKNEEIQLYHGYVAVKNRGSDESLSIQQSLIKEKAYFDSRPEYKNLKDLVGNEALVTRLSTLLYNKITTSLPIIKAEIDENIKENTKKLAALGEPLPQDASKMVAFLNDKIASFTKKLKDVMKGEVSIIKNVNGEDAFQGEAQLRILIAKFKKAKDVLFQKAIDELNREPDKVTFDIMEAKGVFVSGFLPKRVMKRRVQEVLKNLKEETEKFVTDVQQLNEIMLRHTLALMPELSPNNKGIISRRANSHLQKLKETTICLIEEILDSEAEVIWTDEDSSLIRNLSAPERNEPLNESENLWPMSQIAQIAGALRDALTIKKKEAIRRADLDLQRVVRDQEVQLLKTKVYEYFEAMRFTLGDTLTKLVGAKLFMTYCSSLQKYLGERLEDIRVEFETGRLIDPVEQQRERLKKGLENLKNAREIISGVFFD